MILLSSEPWSFNRNQVYSVEGAAAVIPSAIGSDCRRGWPVILMPGSWGDSPIAPLMALALLAVVMVLVPLANSDPVSLGSSREK